MICAIVIVGVLAGLALAQREANRLYWIEQKLDAEERIGAFKMKMEWQKKEDKRLLAMYDNPTPPFWAQFVRKQEDEKTR